MLPWLPLVAPLVCRSQRIDTTGVVMAAAPQSTQTAARTRGPSRRLVLERRSCRSAEALGGRVLGLATADGLNELADVADSVEAATVDELVHLTEAGGRGGLGTGVA